ncbi:hypothetical protein GCM10011344_36450 [Dokdonia pacifica]|uniref:Uncharacterized protein n=1 Tax=Dokdonia pacifica TaxID=1627892 RepID=A0A239AWQ0_9FLAO|nr:DUF6146 family protein [Dokdonia pacifica]GGG32262.1 hypothetical protein GCM10011344_36450 [Dokdonia pacifica]SNS00146.1 hypothetical protein SAMN06265376_105192 [Dokdonia pacifica]
MKKILYTLLLAAFIIGCATTNTKNDIANTAGNDSDTVRIANDSLEFEILIIEPGFNNWLVTQQPRGYYEQPYLENRNLMRVIEYNNRVLESSRFDPNIYLQQINYERGVDYGYEVNYLLHNWFNFFERRYKQKLR